jgi:hypothetical protein
MERIIGATMTDFVMRRFSLGGTDSSWQQLEHACKSGPHADSAEMAPVCRQDAIDLSSFGNRRHRAINQSQPQLP